MCTILLQLVHPCKRQLATGIHLTRQHLCQDAACFGAQIPCLQNGFGLRTPRHGHGSTRDVHHHSIGIGLEQRLDNGILPIGESIFLSVMPLAVLVIILVKATYKYHIVGFLRFGHSISYHLLGSAFFFRHFTGRKSILFRRRLTTVSTFVNDFCLWTMACHPLLQPLKGRHLVLGFQ